ncbi:MAG TPA: cytochrome c biogenesis protein ResB [Spirochaetota bacterium]|nr:cytochrome c biogenesis protein ResB [Spirochaetota bacterium]HOL56718.1 cytochrome c biogenesis protein ResB [Spirochaetota bacterium]HPP04127.1 cytochrome c biogenesis protein ResB [Spirochaetota bacterium]
MKNISVFRVLKNFFKFLKSIKTGIVLLIILVIFSTIAGIIPQGMDIEFYKNNYPTLIFYIIILIRFNNYFESPVFFIISTLFIINLSLCSIPRFILNLKTKLIKGSDFIHIGLLVIIIGGIISIFTRVEDFRWFKIGERIDVGQGKFLEIEKIDLEKYENGKIKNYITQFYLYDSENKKIKEMILKVNYPVSINGINIYQNSYKIIDIVSLASDIGIKKIVNGDSISTNSGNKYTFLKFTDSKLYFKESERIMEFNIGNKIGEYVIENAKSIEMTGLKFVKDYGNISIIIGIILIFIGLILFYIKIIGVTRK